MRTLESLPVFESANRPPLDPAKWRLVVDGRVKKSQAFSLPGLLALPRVQVESDFRCHEGWVVPDVRWEGVGIGELLARAEALPDARYVTVYAGDYTVVLSLEEALHRGVLLATHMNGTLLTPEHGAPTRLVVPAHWDCFASVKWVQRLELTEQRAEATGPGIALRRIGRGKAA